MKKSKKSDFTFNLNVISKYKWYIISGFGVLGIIGVIVMIRGIKKSKLE